MPADEDGLARLVLAVGTEVRACVEMMSGAVWVRDRADKVREILGGKIAGIEVTQGFLLAVSVYVALPSVMVFLSLVLRPAASRWTNVALGAVYAPTIIASAIGEGWAYSIFLSVLEVTLVLLIAWFAWNWPRGPAKTSTAA